MKVHLPLCLFISLSTCLPVCLSIRFPALSPCICLPRNCTLFLSLPLCSYLSCCVYLSLSIPPFCINLLVHIWVFCPFIWIINVSFVCFFYTIQQCWPTHGPRAVCGPPADFKWPAQVATFLQFWVNNEVKDKAYLNIWQYRRNRNIPTSIRGALRNMQESGRGCCVMIGFRL